MGCGGVQRPRQHPTACGALHPRQPACRPRQVGLCHCRPDPQAERQPEPHTAPAARPTSCACLHGQIFTCLTILQSL
ncbi:hypothetical protein VITFI_CDS0044 [Vitreoscilla filiformis]|uniref:Uncharacterized protein n=1 Tax=Vitreoscilla filiformis TaxID=63 RepID=A0A221KAF1_VITFI|nr:hypothetical protein VITFI_CDS0044 [Vitreoscilla filiformis]